MPLDQVVGSVNLSKLQNNIFIVAAFFILSLVFGQSTTHAFFEDQCTRHEAQGIDQAIKCFNQSFTDQSVYSLGNCQTNVHHLAFKLAQVGINSNQAKVLYLLPVAKPDLSKPKFGSTWFHPTNARPSEIPIPMSWLFHVVYEFNGLIFDLNFGKEPSVVTKENYFFSMFSASELDAAFVRIIPANEYMQEYDPEGQKNWQYYLYDLDGRYPMQPLDEYAR